MKGQCVRVFGTLAGAGGRAGGKFFFFLFLVCILRVVIGYNGGGGGEMETHLEGESPSPPPYILCSVPKRTPTSTTIKWDKTPSNVGGPMPQNGGGKGWLTDQDTGQKVMPKEWEDFLEWLLSEERVPSTARAWCDERGLNERSVRRWKVDPRFVREWDRRASELNVHPERTQSVVNALYKQAASGDVKAASLYLQYIERFTPKRRVTVDDERDSSSLSDAELAAELDGLVAGLRSE